jgi:hypothetical protein
VTVADAYGPIDWDCDGSANKLTADINGDSAKNTLNGYDDWKNLKFKVGAIGNAGAVSNPVQTILTEMTPQILSEIKPLDAPAPVTTASSTPPANANGWNDTDVKLTLSATDDNSGVARIEYNIDGAGWTTYTDLVILSSEGVHTFQYRSIDRAEPGAGQEPDAADRQDTPGRDLERSGRRGDLHPAPAPFSGL